MKKIIHEAGTRGSANYGWLKTRYSFSFSGWYNPNRINFGLLRVLNDDIIAGGGGFDTHPHDNMEIVTIPFSGKLAHKDNVGHMEVIEPNEVQVMSAGTGILHSEFNASETEDCSLFQIWVFPDKKNHAPRYDQKKFDPENRKNKFDLLVSPDKSEGNLWLNQNAYFSRADLDAGKTIDYKLHSEENGIYLMVISGAVKIAEEYLSKRDAIGIWEIEDVSIEAAENSEILLIEIPMN